MGDRLKVAHSVPSTIMKSLRPCSSYCDLFLILLALCGGLAAAPVDMARGPGAGSDAAGRQAAMTRWNEAKFGLFLHWGAYSVYGGTYRGKELWSAEWIQENARIPFAEYARTAAEWNPSDFDAEAWVRHAKDAGMGYIVVTAKHHDGFAIYPSKADNYNLMASGVYKGPDPLAALKQACVNHGLLFGIYYSPLEFRGSPKGYDAADAEAIAAGFDYRSLGPKPYASDAEIAAKAHAQIKEIVEWYRPDILWFDGTGHKMGVWTEADARQAEAAIRSVLPNVLINNRLGLKNGDFTNHEGKMPKIRPTGAWEYCWNIGAFWGYNPRNYQEKRVKTPGHYIETLVNVSSLGGNYLLNVGPDSTGKFHPTAVEYLSKIGAWVKPNREAVHGVSGSPFKDPPEWGFITAREGSIYLIVNRWPAGGAPLVMPGLKNNCLGAHMLASPAKPLEVTTGGRQWLITGATPSGGGFDVIVLKIDEPPQVVD
jgi:alpha-L-fucosidase